MSREIPSGTPNRSAGYVQPDRRSPYLGVSLIAAVVVAVVLPLLYLVGQVQLASPGPLATSHANVEMRCEQCHDPRRGVVDLRCERCHDASGADRFTNAAHVLLGSANTRKAEAAPIVDCVTCHTDHRGRTFHIRGVDDRECGRCHKFSSLGRHPEFAAVKAGIQTGVGLSFGHERHIAEVAKQLGKKCEACHQATSDLTGFQPLDFDRHCAGCHTKGGAVSGESEPVAADLLVMTAAGGGEPPQSSPAELGRVVLAGMKHRDAWVLFNAQRLRRMIDGDGANVEAAALRLQISYLTQQLGARPLGSFDRPSLERWRMSLESEIASLDRRLTRAGGAQGDAAALQEIGDTVTQIARQLPQPAGAAIEVNRADPPPSARADEAGSSRLLEARRRELLGALDAIAERGDPRLAERAVQLRKNVEQLKGSGGEADVATLAERLRALDEIFGAVRATADPQAADAASQLAVLRDLAQSQVNGGVTPDDFEARRRELLAALDAVDRSGVITLASRVDALRQRVLSLRPGSYGDAGLRAERGRAAKLLDRVNLELELTRSGEIATPATVPGDSAESIRRMVEEARAQLAALDGGGRPGAAETPAEVRKATSTLSNLLAPCLKCHVMAGAKMAKVAAAGVVFGHARFDHKPHVEQTTCAACHKSVESSIRATDINEPAVASCAECHRPSKSRSDCATCHYYHPPSMTRLMRSL